MSKKKGDHGHDCDGHDHKEHDQEQDCGEHDHDERIVTLQGEDGKSYDCYVAGVFPFEGKEYVLLQTIGEDDEQSQDIETIVMEMIEEDEMATFRSIEDDAEFDRVMDFVMKVAKEVDEAHERGEI